MRSYAQYCPIAKASEILGDRWTLLIVREMLGGASGFNELQRGLPGISRSVLADRLRSLERAEIVARRTGPKGRTLDYRLTRAGRDLESVVQAIGEWGVTWSFTDPRPEELDPDLLIVWMARHVDREHLPADRTVVQFDFRDPAKRYWMVLEPSEVSVCLQHPGFRPARALLLGAPRSRPSLRAPRRCVVGLLGAVVTAVAPDARPRAGNRHLHHVTRPGEEARANSANPHVALAYHARDHGFATGNRYVLVQGRCRPAPQADPPWNREVLGPAAERFMGRPRHGPFWDRWLRDYYADRVPVTVDVDSGGGLARPELRGRPSRPRVAPPRSAASSARSAQEGSGRSR